jgi:hypothetical protein
MLNDFAGNRSQTRRPSDARLTITERREEKGRECFIFRSCVRSHMHANERETTENPQYIVIGNVNVLRVTIFTFSFCAITP